MAELRNRRAPHPGTERAPAHEAGRVNGSGPVPRDLDAERAVLGACLLGRLDVVAEVRAVLPPHDPFWAPRHATLWRVICSLADDGIPPDPLAVAHRAQLRGELWSEPGDQLYAHELYTAAPLTANHTHHARIVAEQAELRGWVEAGTRMLQLAERGDLAQLRQHAGRVRDDVTRLIDGATTATAATVERDCPRIDWKALWNETSADADWLLEPLVEVGQSIAIYSEPKAGKSLVTLEIVAALATGRAVLGNPARRPLRVVYVDLENTRSDLLVRLSAFGYHPDDLDDLVYLSFPILPPLDDPTGGARLLAVIQHYRADVVILDTAARFVDGDENDAATWNAVYRHALVPLKAAGVTVIRLDHSGKDATRGQRGSSAKSGDVDAVWRLVALSKSRISLRRDCSRTGRGDEFIDLERKFEPLRHERIFVSGETTDEIAMLISELARLDVPLDAGRDPCREALRKIGIKVGNDRLGEVIKRRKEPAPGAPTTMRDEEWVADPLDYSQTREA